MDGHRHRDSHDPARKGFLARFGRDSRGATVIEFAFLAIPFSLLVFAILESCISFAAQEVMANATDTVARQLRTGQVRPADVTKTKVEQMICEHLEIIVAKDCPGLDIDLRTFDSFESAAKTGFTIADREIVLTKDGTRDAKQFVVEPGPSMSKNMLRVFYKWPVMTDFMAKSMASLKDGTTLHFASVTWQNEPFN